MEPLTIHQKKMLGTKYITKEGSEITVVGVHSKRNHKTTYELHCSICSLDLEMFPKGSIYSVSDTIRNKRTPCGCSVKYKCSEDQYRIRIGRKCRELGYSFNGFYEKFSGCDTLLRLFNPVTNNSWETTSIQSLLVAGTKDPLGWENRRGKTCIKSDQYFVDKFNKTGVFPEGTEFWKIGGSRWRYRCPSCSEDEYVKEGLCSGVFESSAGHMSNGKLSCRCSVGRYRWNTEQREYQISKRLEGSGAVFSGWEDPKGYKNTRSKLRWVCDNGHTNIQTFYNFINRRGCRKCSKNGFNPSLPATIYLVRWTGEEGNYLKFGITNKTVNERVVNQKAVSNLNPEVLHTFRHQQGSVIDLCEKKIKETLESGTCPKHLLPRGFTETVHDTPENLAKLLDIISTFNLKETTNDQPK
ncbi:putative homing endonuclease [Vibrio phage 496E54-1]|nr:putative homing endonuclease [Vibrio phage 496E54-1]